MRWPSTGEDHETNLREESSLFGCQLPYCLQIWAPEYLRAGVLMCMGLKFKEEVNPRDKLGIIAHKNYEQNINRWVTSSCQSSPIVITCTQKKKSTKGAWKDTRIREEARTYVLSFPLPHNIQTNLRLRTTQTITFDIYHHGPFLSLQNASSNLLPSHISYPALALLKWTCPLDSTQRNNPCHRRYSLSTTSTASPFHMEDNIWFAGSKGSEHGYLGRPWFCLPHQVRK